MGTDAQEHALARWWRGHPSLPWIAGLVILNEAPQLVLLLAVGPALLWLTTWIWEGRPPKGWSVKDPARSDQAHQRLRKLARRDLIFGLVLAVGTLIFALLQISTHH